jgi:hypothetical protein
MKIKKQWYICLRDSTNSPLTKGKKYKIWQTRDNKKEGNMYTIDHYDDEKEPSLLNDYWYNNNFKLVKMNIPNNVKIL